MADFDPDAYLASSSPKSSGGFDPDAYLRSAKTAEPEAADHGLSERQKLSPVGKALSPLTGYWETYGHMNQESRDQMSRGLEQITHPDSLIDPQAHGISDVLSGIGNVAAGGMNYVTSPVTAAYRSVVGQPIEDVTGIPREYPEFAAQLATPGLGFSKLPGRPVPVVPKPAPNGPFGFSYTEGEATGNLAARQREQAAYRGQLGPAAQQHAQEFYDVQRPEQSNAAKEVVARGLDTHNGIVAETPTQAADTVQQSLQKEAARSKANVEAKYDYAKSLPGEIHSEFFRNMPASIKADLSNRAEPVFVDENTPVASRMMNYIQDRISNLNIKNLADVNKPPDPNSIAGVSLEGVDQWRKALSSMRGDALRSAGVNASDARAARSIMEEFDNNIDSAVNSPAFRGDPRAVEAYNDARAAHTERMRTYGNDPIGKRLKSIIGDPRLEKDPAALNDVANFIYSAQGQTPNSLNVGVAKRIKKVLGEDSPEWAAVRQGMFHRLVSVAKDEEEKGVGVIANRISRFLDGKGSDLAKELYTPEQQALLQEYGKLHRTLQIPKQGANWSNSATGIAPYLEKIGAKISGLVGAVIGHHIMPGIGGEAAGYVAGSYIPGKVQNATNARKIAAQMPVIARQVQQWKSAATRAQRSGSSASKLGLTASLSSLTRQLPKMDAINIRPLSGAVPSAAQGNQDKGSGRGNAEPDQGAGNKAHGGSIGRARGGSSKASGGAVSRAIRASKGYAEGGAPELSDDDQAAMMPETFVPEGVRKWTEQAAPKDYNLISGSVKGMATLPQRAIESARNYRETGEYDPGPILEAATLPMGTGAIAGLRMAPREVALGAGPIRAYHGSPHDFDKFDLSKIGTGEGAQAYGHGLYFADSEGVAKSYRDGLKSVGQSQPVNVASKVLESGGEPLARTRLAQVFPNMSGPEIDAAIEQARNLPPGKMYEVNINADPSHFLDWDKPLSQQHPAVREKLTPEAMGLKPAGPLGDRGYYGYVDDKGRLVGRATTGRLPEEPFPGSEMASSIARGMGTWKPEEGAAALRQAGIPGIKYLDQGSRNAGQGSSNYVVFNHDLINIVRKYALAGIALPPAIAEAYEQMQQNGRATGGAVSRAVRASKGYETGGAPEDIDWSRMNQPFGSITSEHVPASTRIGDTAQEGLVAAGMKPYAAQHLREGVGGLLDWTGAPNVVDTVEAQSRGDQLGVVKGMAGMIPGVGKAGVGLVRKTAGELSSVGAGDVALGSSAMRKVPLDMSEEARLARAKEQGFEGPWYHGGLRMDRFTEKGKVDPKRATSGPMPYFTDDPEMASAYAMGKKPDTSLVDNGQVADYFTVAPKDLGISGRRPLTVEQSWHFLPQEVKQDILSKATRVGHTDLEQQEGALMLHPEGVNATNASKDHWDYIMKREARGNPLAALRDLWHDSGRFVDDPSQLSDVFRLAGYPHPISEATAPWTEARGVFPAMLRMTNPLKTDDAELLREKILPALESAFKTDRSRKAQFGADMWDKHSRYTPKEWVQQAKEDLAKGDNSYVWTSIPDKVTNELRRLGYDGILDMGGKGGGAGHKVAIPFEPTQVRSKFAKFDPKKTEGDRLHEARGGPVMRAIRAAKG